jgi:zinc D-Ala-D-Ala carboxypeptidase
MNLSEHFTLDEFCTSQTAARLGILNDPPLEVVSHLKRTAEGMEKVRSLLGNKPIHINSGYRSLKVNAAVGSKATSQHVTGQACDFICPSYGMPESIMKAIISSPIEYDQCILEFGQWVHISFTSSPRKQALIIDHSGTRGYK